MLETAAQCPPIGTSGAGKTTFGREIARRMNTVFVEVDSIQHKAHGEEGDCGGAACGIAGEIGDRGRAGSSTITANANSAISEQPP